MTLKTFEGHYDGKGLKFGIVVSRFNSTVTERLLEGALDCLLRHGVDENDIEVVRVPGSLEVIYTLNLLTKSDKYDAIIVLAAVIQGDTYHFNIVANEIGKAVAQFNMNSNMPITFGVITTETVEQALNRAGIKSGNKGFEAAMAALEMANLRRKICV
ncbi:6,7-dimethyl-8-ribityllumazine synthase [Fervidobacterium riparium]|uniref:6,7-dimethyl-8-ribityllumazine synthase n=1 Tax=Fervidobacterium gondwanense DSM 13020 TaxID=1121883 RepID=A0A1M7TAX6_FERGO|nr:6,7-dimethyl-8-ribityllumazine synthase [Fervidobacterium gondwanense]UXF00983.1 6,7-dimethyl-8-ribityllumazine synthase [Fervidobacterium riparium]SHN67872.1 6,7-dimethyl-8-ribityllumazine synthase [Fervidobacterium gondwanense DSM 13020]